MLQTLQIILIALGSLAFAFDAAAAEPATRPNIVFMLADDLGWADIGCYGNRFNETPRLDAFATTGLKFTSFYAACAVCSPTRASILTGQYPARIGLTAHIPGHWRPFEKLVEPPIPLALPLELITTNKALKSAGYATGHFGKWHLGGVKFGPKEQGFDESLETGQHSTLDPATKTRRRTAELITDLSIAFIEKHKAGPFYVEIHQNAPHIPLDTTPVLRKKYEAKPKVPGYSCNPLYAGLVEEIDTSAGRVLDALDRLGLAERTIVVFTSDNGGLEKEAGGWPGTINRPLRDEKGTLYEGGIRVPMLVRYPGMTKAGSITACPAMTTDFFPTFLSAANVERPKEQACDGVSLLPLLRDPAALLNRPAIFWHYPHYHHSRPACAVRAGDFKLIQFYDTGEAELYNVKDDIAESKNLAATMPEKARELIAMLARWRHEVNAQMPRANPAYDPQRAGEWWDRRTIKPTEAPGTYKPAVEAGR